MDQYGTMGPLRRDIVEELLNAEKRTIGQIASFFEVDYFTVRNFIRANRIPILVPKSGRRIDAKKKQEAMRLLQETDMSILQIAKRLGFRSRSAIYEMRNSLRKQKEREAVSEEPHGLSFVQIGQREQSRKCPTHGRVSVWPCVMCEAEKYRKLNRSVVHA